MSTATDRTQQAMALRDRIAKLKKDQRDTQDQVDELEGQVEEMEIELDALRTKLEQVELDAKSDGELE